MNLVKEGEIVNIQAYKQDGKLYRQWNGCKILLVIDEYIVVIMHSTKVIGLKEFWKITTPTIWYFHRTKFFNSFSFNNGENFFNYTNLASPFFMEEKTIKYIDYDIDIKFSYRKGIKVVDLDEYKENSKEFNYPEKLKGILEKTVLDLVEKIGKEEQVFSKTNFLKLLKIAKSKNII